MFRRVLTWSVAGASPVIALAMLAGLLAPFDPRLEMANHFRPFLLLAALVVLVLAALLRRKFLFGAALALSLALAALTLLPLLYAAPSAANENPILRVASFNISLLNDRLPEAAKFLIGINADVIVLQEVLCEKSDPLFEALRPAYPHIFRASERCFGQAVLSKHPITATGRFEFKWRRPLWVWADITYRGTAVRITGVHLSHPTRPFDQVSNVNELIAHIKATKLPHVIAGDFNLTPYSWLLTKFSHQSGVRRHATYRRSWPSDFIFPIVLIDHVFSSRHFARAKFTIGADIGSDHYPVIADLILR
jgi:endonuclease/exonuclease/phosphatase (EEP) superfamily protein YafD